MPNGKVHAVASLLTAAVSGSVLYFGNLADLALSLNVAAGAASGVLISPDLDIDNGNISNSYIRKISPLLSWVWRWLWFPYGKVFRHRGMSHWPIIGTCTRLLYILLLFSIIAIILILFTIRISLPTAWIFPAIVGLALADLIHIILDVIT